MKLSIVIYDGFTSLDAIGAYEVLSRIPGMEVEWIAATKGVIVADTRGLGILAFRSFDEVTSTDILFVPGGPGGVERETDEPFLAKLRELDETSTWTMSACNGSALLAAAGMLKGRKATTNWFYQHRLKDWGAEFVPVRYLRDGKYVTCAGVSASIDGGLFMAEILAGTAIAKTIQLGVEYYPGPPFPERSAAEAPEDAQAIMRAFDEGGGGLALLDIPPAFTGSYAVVERTATGQKQRVAI